MVNLRVFKSINPFLLTALAVLAAFLVLFVFRSADDNRLFSWEWVFSRNNISGIFLLFIIGLIAAYPLARSSIFGRQPVLFLFLCSFAAPALLWIEPELILDASRYFTQAKHLEVYGAGYFLKAWGVEFPAWTDLPAVPFLYGVIFRFFGENRLFIQAFTTLLFSGTAVLVLLIGKTLWGEETGFYAGMLLLGMPFLLAQVPLMLVDVPTMFFLTLSIFTHMKTLEHGRGLMTALSILSLFFTVFSKYSAWLMLSVLGIIFLVYWRKDPKPVFLRSLAVLLPALFLIGVVVIMKYDVISGQLRLLASYQRPGLERWQENHLSTFFFQVHPFITLAAGYSLIAAFRKRDWKYAIISWLIVLMLVLDIKRSRYILPAFPMLALMAAYGLQYFQNKDVRRYIVSAITVSSLVITFAAYLPFARQVSANNLKAAGEYLNARDREAIEVLALPLRDPVVNPSVSIPLLDLFTNKRIRYQYLPESFPPPKDVETWSLRYTWEYQNPEYYTERPADDDTELVIISGETDRVIPPLQRKRLEHYRLLKRFALSTDPFRMKTIVEIYTKD